MKLTLSPDANKNYVATIVELKTERPIKGADFLKCTNIYGNNVVVSIEAKVGDIGVFVPLESQLLPWFLSENNWYRDTTLNANYNEPVAEGEKRKTGFFEEKGRVRAVKLRNEKSEGYYFPLEGSNLYPVGFDFDTIDDRLFVKKYVVKEVKTPGTPGKKGDKKLVKKFDRIVENQFRLHVDTAQLKKNIFQLDPDDYIGVHYKKHGTSWVVSHCLTNVAPTWKTKIAKLCGVDIVEQKYDIIYSSRKVIKNQFAAHDGQNTYYDYDLWKDIADKVGPIIPKSYTLYGEAIGYLPNGGFIQRGFDYGCKPGEYKLYVYRITITNVEGKVVELDDKQIEQFCERNGLLYKDTFIFYGEVKEHVLRLALGTSENNIERMDAILHSFSEETDVWREKYLEMLVEKYNEKDCYMCVNKVPEEGIVIRKQDLYDYNAFKLKSFRFLEKETLDLDKGEVDLESQN